MSRKNAYLVILRSYADETLAMGRIMRLRLRRRLAEEELAQRRRIAAVQRAWHERRARIERALEGIRGDRDR
jgi:hypothetical protein